eukprot:Gregarina_sp_Poly_1__1462@NODE_1366_length_4286_cov_184_663901_g914_i0_p4_GENE_NODE_1366_length_4286_cov_184_663901_g914_i0NODE_1366_length_4286_cov_184_663901_g914_i0_p4_ORF_typecomplete_len173_score26_88Sybindin/PF04099_12/3_5e21_NODE_1366_length_4286_cov_184_663901_g914_i013881906
MSIYSFLIFDRKFCLFQHDWENARRLKGKEQQRQQRLLHGLIFSLKRFCEKIGSPLQDGTFASPLDTMTTSQYKLHMFESLSGYKFVLLTDPVMPSQKAKLKCVYGGSLCVKSFTARQIFETLFVPLVIMAPDFQPSTLQVENTGSQKISALIHTTTFPSSVREFLDKLNGV